MNITPEVQDMARDVLDYINKHPDEHNQATWVCSTTMCVGGTAVVLHYGNRSLSKINRGLGFLDNNFKNYSDLAYPLLGFEHKNESCWLFYEMDNEAAIQKLKLIAAGDTFAVERGIEEWNRDGGFNE